MPRQYPRISGRKKYKGHPNGLPNCPCGTKAVYRVEIQVNWFRGDDESEPRCEKHKDDAEVTRVTP